MRFPSFGGKNQPAGTPAKTEGMLPPQPADPDVDPDIDPDVDPNVDPETPPKKKRVDQEPLTPPVEPAKPRLPAGPRTPEELEALGREQKDVVLKLLESLQAGIVVAERDRMEKRFGKGIFGRAKEYIATTVTGRLLKITGQVGVGVAMAFGSAALAGTPGMLLSPTMFTQGIKNIANGVTELCQVMGGDGKRITALNKRKLEYRCNFSARLDELVKNARGMEVGALTDQVEALVSEIYQQEACRTNEENEDKDRELKSRKFRGAVGTGVAIATGILTGVPFGTQNYDAALGGPYAAATHAVRYGQHGMEFLYNSVQEAALSGDHINTVSKLYPALSHTLGNVVPVPWGQILGGSALAIGTMAARTYYEFKGQKPIQSDFEGSYKIITTLNSLDRVKQLRKNEPEPPTGPAPMPPAAGVASGGRKMVLDTGPKDVLSATGGDVPKPDQPKAPKPDNGPKQPAPTADNNGTKVMGDPKEPAKTPAEQAAEARDKKVILEEMYNNFREDYIKNKDYVRIIQFLSDKAFENGVLKGYDEKDFPGLYQDFETDRSVFVKRMLSLDGDGPELLKNVLKEALDEKTIEKNEDDVKSTVSYLCRKAGQDTGRTAKVGAFLQDPNWPHKNIALTKGGDLITFVNKRYPDPPMKMGDIGEYYIMTGKTKGDTVKDVKIEDLRVTTTENI